MGLAESVSVVEPCVTVTGTIDELLPVQLASPWYVARITCEPADKLFNVSCAALLATETVPSVVDVVRSVNVTVPVAGDGYSGWMLAFRTTGIPYGALLGPADKLVVVGDWLTVSVTAFEVIGPKFVSPL